MARLVLPIIAASFCAALLAPAAIYGKGATSGEIAGPGLDDPIVMNGTWNQLARIAEAGGFYAAAFGRVPDPLLTERPRGDLGPRYTIAYVMPGPNGETDELVQNVYPYAQPAPITYTAEGLRFFGRLETRGGWFVATAALKDYLVEAGLPRSAPVPAEGSRFSAPAVGAAVLFAAVLAGCVLPTALLRRRPRIA